MLFQERIWFQHLVQTVVRQRYHTSSRKALQKRTMINPEPASEMWQDTRVLLGGLYVKKVENNVRTWTNPLNFLHSHQLAQYHVKIALIADLIHCLNCSLETHLLCSLQRKYCSKKLLLRLRDQHLDWFQMILKFYSALTGTANPELPIILLGTFVHFKYLTISNPTQMFPF